MTFGWGSEGAPFGLRLSVGQIHPRVAAAFRGPVAQMALDGEQVRAHRRAGRLPVAGPDRLEDALVLG